jgi:prepilin-type N-terminal cleavage/methylation domain-containing protein
MNGWIDELFAKLTSGKKQPPAHNAEGGFTLIELLAALAAGSLLLVSLGQVFGQVRGSWQMARTTARLVATQTAGLTRLDQLVSSALPSNKLVGDFSFAGNANGFRIRTLPPHALQQIGVVWAEVTVRTVNNRSLLDVTLSSATDSPTINKAPVNSTGLLDLPNRISFLYGMRARDGSIEAKSSVAETGDLPAYIEMQQVQGNDMVQRVLLVPRNSVDGRCLFDPVSMACRI